MNIAFDDGTTRFWVSPTEWELLNGIADAALAFQTADAARSIDSIAAIYTTTTKYLEARGHLNECLEMLRIYREARP